MKKLTALCLTALICLTLFSGCGTEKEEIPAELPVTEEKPTEAEPVSTADDTVLTIKGVTYSEGEVNLCLADQFYSFLETYGDYASLYGLDTSTGIAGLREQTCEYSEDGTWYGYFMGGAVQMLQEMQALCDYARENGIDFTDEEIEEIESQMEAITASAADSGFESEEAFLTEYFGADVTMDIFRDYIERNALAGAAYNTYYASLTYTDEEIDAHYGEMDYEEGENDYCMTSMRHLLIMAQPDENGEYSDEAILAAHERAEELYEQWSAGDKTEESFAALVNEYSEDGGSNTVGGLYEDIFKGQMVEGIDTWLFEEGRAPGDTAVIDNNGSYVGTHIVYFAGTGELYSRVLSRDDLIQTSMSEWFVSLLTDYTVEEGPAFDNVGVW